jgi:DNA-binding NtrC family response regulator
MLCDAANGARVPSIENMTKSDRIEQHVLIVDDEANVLASVGVFLEKAGFAVHKSVSGNDALRIISNDSAIEILVTDFAMPGMSGAELISEAMQIRPNLKALIMTGYPDADGMTDLPRDMPILVKPFRRTELITRVKSLLGEMETMLA